MGNLYQSLICVDLNFTACHKYYCHKLDLKQCRCLKSVSLIDDIQNLIAPANVMKPAINLH
jgi:hypothetical protein